MLRTTIRTSPEDYTDAEGRRRKPKKRRMSWGSIALFIVGAVLGYIAVVVIVFALATWLK